MSHLPLPTFTYTQPVWDNPKRAPSPPPPPPAPASVQLPIYANLSAPYVQSLKPSAFCQSYGAQVYPQYAQILPDSSYYSGYYAPVNPLAQSAPIYSSFNPQFFIPPNFNNLVDVTVPGPNVPVRIVERKRCIGNYVRVPTRLYLDFIWSHTSYTLKDPYPRIPTANLCHGSGYYEVTDYYVEYDHGASDVFQASTSLKAMLFSEAKPEVADADVKVEKVDAEDDIIVDVVGDTRSAHSAETNKADCSDGVSDSDSYDEDAHEAEDSP